MERTFTKLFDYQKFVKNPKLQSAIDSVHIHPRELLLDDVAELVSAAGTPYYKAANNDEKIKR